MTIHTYFGEPASKAIAAANDHLNSMIHAMSHMNGMSLALMQGASMDTVVVLGCLNDGKPTTIGQAVVDLAARMADDARDVHTFLTQTSEALQAHIGKQPTPVFTWPSKGEKT